MHKIILRFQVAVFTLFHTTQTLVLFIWLVRSGRNTDFPQLYIGTHALFHETGSHHQDSYQ